MFLNKNDVLNSSGDQEIEKTENSKKPQASFKPVREGSTNEGLKFNMGGSTTQNSTSGIQSRHIQSSGLSNTSSQSSNNNNNGSSSGISSSALNKASSFNTGGLKSTTAEKPKASNAMMVFSDSEDDQKEKIITNEKNVIQRPPTGFNSEISKSQYYQDKETVSGHNQTSNKPLMSQNNQNSMGASASSGFNSSARPGTSSSSSQRLQLLQEQKRQLQEKLKMQDLGTSIKKNENFKPNLGEGEARYDNDDIDYENLQKIVKEKPSSMVYEPGRAQMSSQPTFVPLSKQTDQITFNENEVSEQILVVKDNRPEQQDIDLINKQKSSEIEQTQPKVLHKKKPSIDEEVEQEEQEKAQSKNKKQDSQKQDKDDQEEEEEEEQEEEEEEEQEDEDENEEELRRQLEQMKQNKQNKEKDAKVQLSQQQHQEIKEQKKLNLPKIIEYNQIPDMKSFLTSPVPKGVIVQTTIKRDKSGFARFYPKYHCYLSNSNRQIISGQKRSANNTSNYLMCMNQNDLSTSSPGYLGKVRSNFLGTQFRMYDTGENPKKAQTFNKIRKEIGAILYESNLLGARGPRKIRVLTPSLQDSGEPIEWKPLKEKDGMIQKFQSGSTDGLMFFRNQPPKWNDVAGAFVLNFNGRVTQPSVKNFQLIDDNNEDLVYLQFGRIEDEHFNLDFQWPISPLQAFAIALSSFDYKIACE